MNKNKLFILALGIVGSISAMQNKNEVYSIEGHAGHGLLKGVPRIFINAKNTNSNLLVYDDAIFYEGPNDTWDTKKLLVPNNDQTDIPTQVGLKLQNILKEKASLYSFYCRLKKFDDNTEETSGSAYENNYSWKTLWLINTPKEKQIDPSLFQNISKMAYDFCKYEQEKKQN